MEKKSILKRENIENFNNYLYLSCLKQKSPVLWTLNCSYYTDQEMKDELILNMFQKKLAITLPQSTNTLSFYSNEPSKNKHFLIFLSSLARNSQEPKLKRIFEIP